MKVVCNHYDEEKCKKRFPSPTHSCYRGYFEEEEYSGFISVFPKGIMEWHCGRFTKEFKVQWELHDFEWEMKKIIEEEDEKNV